MTALRGSCLCGGVRFEIDGPLMRASHCHCRQCQKAHGAPFRTRARAAAADFRFLAGEELVSFYESTPGNVVITVRTPDTPGLPVRPCRAARHAARRAVSDRL